MSLQQQMSLFQEGGLEQDGNTVDPVSGNDVPVGSSQEEVRDDIPAQLSEGEFVFPADVVRFIGLEKLMMMRQEAKAGLKRMEEMGQMGNSEEATIPDDVPFDINDLEMEDEPQEFQEGGSVEGITQGGFRRVPERPRARIPRIPEDPIMPFPPSPNEEATFRNAPTEQPPTEDTGTTFESLLGESPETYDELRKYVGPNGEIRYIAFKDDLPLPAYAKILDNLVKTGYTYEDPAETSQEDEDVTDVGVETAQVRPDKENDTTSPQSMRKAEQERIQSFKSAIEAVMKETGITDPAEAAQYIKDGNHKIKGIKVPGFLFTDFNLVDGKVDASGIARPATYGLDQAAEEIKNEVISAEQFNEQGFVDENTTNLQVATPSSAAVSANQQPVSSTATQTENTGTIDTGNTFDEIKQPFTIDPTSVDPMDRIQSNLQQQFKDDDEKEANKQAVILEAQNKRLAEANIAAAKAKEQRKAEAKAKRDAEIRQAQASKWSGMGKSIADASQGGRDKSTGQVNTTNLRSRSKGGLLNKKPKKKKVMKRGGLASKK